MKILKLKNRTKIKNSTDVFNIKLDTDEERISYLTF